MSISLPCMLVILQPGDTWIPYSKDSCTAYTCSYVNGQFILSESSKNCTPPKQPICNPGEIPFNCCYACDPALCKLKTRPLEIDEGLTATKITDSYCELEDSTASLYPPEVYKAMLSCQCCKMVQSSMKTVTLIFKDGQSIEYKYSYAEKCGCTSCKWEKIYTGNTTGLWHGNGNPETNGTSKTNKLRCCSARLYYCCPGTSFIFMLRVYRFGKIYFHE